jgi:hypothetical protein
MPDDGEDRVDVFTSITTAFPLVPVSSQMSAERLPRNPSATRAVRLCYAFQQTLYSLFG